MALVLTRKVGEKIVIDHDIVVTVIEVRGREEDTHSVRIAIEAPDDVQIDREEVYAQREADAATEP